MTSSNLTNIASVFSMIFIISLIVSIIFTHNARKNKIKIFAGIKENIKNKKEPRNEFRVGLENKQLKKEKFLIYATRETSLTLRSY